jgi:hypothetical protein
MRLWRTKSRRGTSYDGDIVDLPRTSPEDTALNKQDEVGGVPTGHWHIVTNGFQGDLDIVCTAEGGLGGTIRIDFPTVDPIVGLWSEAEQKIHFRRDVVLAGRAPQNYTGFLFNVEGSLLQEGVYGPPVEVKYRILAGSFDCTDTGITRPLYGWMAWQRI